MAPPIPGLVGAGAPSYRTADGRWLALDSLVREAVARLEEEGEPLSAVAVKATVQLARVLVQGPEPPQGEALFAVVSERLRALRVLMPPREVRRVLLCWLALMRELEVREIVEVI